MLAGVEDARDSVGLGEQRGVHHGEREAGAESGKWIKLSLNPLRDGKLLWPLSPTMCIWLVLDIAN